MASVKVFEKTENSELEIELPVKRNDKGDAFILMSALEAKFPSSRGLKYKANTWQDLIEIDQKIFLQQGWDQNCRYYVVYQRNDPEDIDKPPSKKFKATQFEFANVSEDNKSIYQAAQIAQLFLNTERFRFLLKFHYKLEENFFSEKIRSILIRFYKQAPQCIASIDRFDNNTNIISINDLYKSRIDQIDENSQEYKNIIVQLAFVIYHEIGHLLLKWKGIQCSTEFYPTCLEAGEYLERGLFLYPVNLLFSFGKKWTKNTRILGLGLETYNVRNTSISMIKPSYIEYLYQHGLDYEKSDYFDETSIELLSGPLPKGHYARKIRDEFTKFVSTPLPMQAIAISPCDSRKWPDQKNSSTSMPEIDLNKMFNQVLRAASLVNGLVYGTNEIIEVFESGQTVELCIAASNFDEHDFQRIETLCQKYDVTLFKDQEERTLSKYKKRDKIQQTERKVPLCVAITIIKTFLKNWGRIGDAHADLKEYFEYLDDE